MTQRIRALKISLILTAIVFVVELGGGMLSNSLALFSDAGHIFTDVFALGLALYAVIISQKSPNQKKTFGYHRVEIIAAFINASALLAVACFIIVEAILRFQTPENINPLIVILSATIGVIINLYIGFSLSKEGHDLNIKAATLDAFSDAISSIAAICAAIIIYITGSTLADPILSIGIALFIGYKAYKLLRETIDILLESVPEDIVVSDLINDMLKINGIKEIHDLHIWTLSHAQFALACHILVDNITISQSSSIQKKLKIMLNGKYHITHTTCQFELTKEEEQCLDETL